MTNEEFLKDICPNHTEKSKWNRSELLHILELYKEAINYSQCCTQLKDKKVIKFDLWCKIKNIHHSFDDFYLWDTTLIEKEYVLKMYQTFIQNL